MIRALTAADVPAYRALWEEGLHALPNAFLLSLQEAQAVPDAHLTQMMAAGGTWGAFDGDVLIGLAVLRPGALAHLVHTGDIGPIYVSERAQGRGIGRALLEALLNHARSVGLLQVELCVDSENRRARALYEQAGFVQFGLRPRSVIIAGSARDDVLMMCRLDATA